MSRCVYHLKLASVSAAMLVVTLPAFGQSADLRVTPYLNVTEMVTDNARLTLDDTKDWAAITEVTPGISLQGQNRRLSYSANYRYQSLFYVGEFEDRSAYHQLNANGHTEVVKNHLVVDANATVTQQLVDPQRPLPNDNLSITNNLTTAQSIGVTPQFMHRIGSWAKANYRYSRYWTDFTSGALQRSGYEEYGATFSSADRFYKMPWSVRYQRRNSVVGSERRLQSQEAEGSVRYVVSRKLSFLANGGYTKNRYVQVQGLQSPQGTNWRVGLAWHPTVRTTFQATGGQTYYGDTYQGSISHRGRHWQISGGYNETVISGLEVRQFQQHNLVTELNLSAEQQQRIRDQFDIQDLTSVNLPETLQDVMIRRRANLSLSAQRRRLSLQGSVYAERRSYQTITLKEELLGGSGQASLQLGRRGSLNLTASAVRRDFKPGRLKYGLANGGLSYSRKIGENTTVSGGYQYSALLATDNRLEYERNLVRLGVRASF